MKKLATPGFALMLVITLAASLLGTVLKGLPVLHLFGPLIIALLVGMALQFPLVHVAQKNPTLGAQNKKAAGWIANRLLRAGIILLGFKLNLSVLLSQGAVTLPLAALVVAATTVGTYALARKLRVDPMLAILTAGGTAICGAAAVMGLSGSLPARNKEEAENKGTYEVTAVATVAIMGTLFSLIEIALGALFPWSSHTKGMIAGASLHEIAHAVAAGDAFGAVDVATIMKLSRVLMLVVAALAIAYWWKRTYFDNAAGGQNTQAKVSFPYFMLGFIAASIVGTYVPFFSSIADTLVTLAYVLLGMAMCALGCNVNFRALWTQGRNAVLASFLASIVLMLAVTVIIVFLGL